MTNNYFRSNFWVKTVLGPAVAGAQIWVTTQPANETLPPSPLALIYSDNGLTPINQPIFTDGSGFADFYVLPGLYTIIIAYNGQIQEVLTDFSVGGVGTSGNPLVTFETNGTPNFDQTLQNMVQGVGIQIVTDNLGNTVITNIGVLSGAVFETNGVANPDQSVLNLQSTPQVAITSDGSGDVTFSTDTLPQPDYARFAMWQPNSTFGAWAQINDNQNEAGDFGTWNAPDANDGAYYSSNGFAPVDSPLGWNGGFQFWPGRTLNFKTTMKVPYLPTTPAGSIYIGLSEAASGNNVEPATEDCIMFLMVQSGAVSLVVGTGGTNTTVPLFTAVAGTRYALQATLSGGVVSAYVNGVLMGTCSTNVPTSNALAINYRIRVATSGVFTCYTEYMYADNLVP